MTSNGPPAIPLPGSRDRDSKRLFKFESEPRRRVTVRVRRRAADSDSGPPGPWARRRRHCTVPRCTVSRAAAAPGPAAGFKFKLSRLAGASSESLMTRMRQWTVGNRRQRRRRPRH